MNSVKKKKQIYRGKGLGILWFFLLKNLQLYFKQSHTKAVHVLEVKQNFSLKLPTEVICVQWDIRHFTGRWRDLSLSSKAS